MDKKRFEEGMAYAEKNYKAADSHLHLDKKLFLNELDLSGKEILDFGCGMGGMSLWIAENWDCKVTALDIDPFHIKIAKALKEKYNRNNISFSEQNILEKPLDKKFDFITLFDVAEHIDVNILKDIFKTLNSHLKEDGKIYISYPPWDGPWGSHLNTITSFPWPQFLPKKYLFKMLDERNQATVGRNDVKTNYLELNHLRPGMLRRLMKEAGFEQTRRISHSIMNRIGIFKNINFNVFPFKYIVSKELVFFRKAR
ncbi:MAG: methyltransferase domain-containing protein [Fulvivirga sp.]|nr:methyltransferase domain-containing protein [Fulvivirga sp.]